MTDFRPRRSVLYLPAANARAIAKARTLDSDCFILDLEDAVAPAMKDDARRAAVAAAHDGGWGDRELIVRVNGGGTAWVEADFAAVAAAGFAAIVAPKAETPDEAAAAVARARGVPVWAMIETPRGVLAVEAIAAVPGVTALVAGMADLTKDLRARPGPDRLPLIYSLSRIVLAARASAILAFDGVYTDIGDAAGLRAEAEQGRALGFDGKTLIHPSQIDVANAAFGPTADDIAAAVGTIAAYDAALADGRGVAVYDGKMVEVLHVATARQTLAEAAAIAAREVRA